MKQQEIALHQGNLTFEQLPPERQEAILARIDGLRQATSQALLTFGLEAQTKVTEYANQMLSNIDQTEKAEDIDRIIAEALDVSKGVTGEPEKKGFLQRVFSGKSKESPFQGSLFAGKVQKLVEAIDVQIGQLMSENIMYDDFIQLLIENVDTATEMIEALERYREELQKTNDVTVVDGEETDASQQMAAMYQKTMLQHRLEQVERKLHMFRISKQESMQVAVSARIIQNNNNVLSDRLQTLLVVGIPILQNQILLKASMADTQKGLEMSDKIAESIQEAMKQNATQLKTITGRLGKSGEIPLDETAVLNMSQEILSIADELRSVNTKTAEEVRQMQAQMQKSDETLTEVFARLSASSENEADG